MIKKLMDFSDAQILSKEEQKDLKGGYAVDCLTKPGSTQTSPGSISGGTKKQCQQIVDEWCSKTDGCAFCVVH